MSNTGKRRIYVHKDDVDTKVSQINHQQAEAGIFVNISVESYKGKKHDQDNTVAVVIG